MKKFVFVIVPMINPDGVYRGYSTIDLEGKDIENAYIKANAKNAPSTFALREFINDLNETQRFEGILYLSSELGSSKMSFKLPLFTKKNYQHILTFPYFLGNLTSVKKFKKRVKVASTPLLKELSVINDNMMVSQVVLPTIKQHTFHKKPKYSALSEKDYERFAQKIASALVNYTKAKKNNKEGKLASDLQRFYHSLVLN